MTIIVIQNYIKEKEAEGQTIENAAPLTEEEKVELNEGGEDAMEKPPEPVPAEDATDEELYSIRDFTV